MGKRTGYEPGTFCWVELSTTDPAAAKSFYGDLFGWSAEDSEVPDGGIYTTLTLGGERVGALQQKPEQQEALPPYWFNYISVASADDAAAAAKDAGGSVHMDPFDVMDAGRMTVVMDPTGAAFGVWEPKEHFGASLVNAPGAVSWNELATNDPAAAQEFYSAVFGWGFETVDTGPDGVAYWTITHEGAAAGQNGGLRELTEPEQGVPPHWAAYFGVESTDDSLAKAEELGGRMVVPAMDVPAGRFAGVADPQGAIFLLFQGDFDD